MQIRKIDLRLHRVCLCPTVFFSIYYVVSLALKSPNHFYSFPIYPFQPKQNLLSFFLIFRLRCYPSHFLYFPLTFISHITSFFQCFQTAERLGKNILSETYSTAYGRRRCICFNKNETNECYVTCKPK